MSVITPSGQSELYKFWERKSHVTLDDVLNKATQEVIELLGAIEGGKQEEIFSEAGDVLANILSLASELGCNMQEVFSSPVSSEGHMLSMYGQWNEQVQALRGRYSRKQGNHEQVESLTKDFISTVLNYTDPEKSLGEILEVNQHKIMERSDQYKPNINIKDYIAEYPDFPIEGVNFKDISPLIANADAMRYVCHEMAERCRGADKIVALDARGFIFAPMIAEILGIPWVMCRKKGKLPGYEGDFEEVSYGLEYGDAIIEMRKLDVHEGEKVAIVDDLLATGGTAGAAIKLVEKLGGKVSHAAFVIGLDEEFLLGKQERQELNEYPYSTVVSYSE